MSGHTELERNLRALKQRSKTLYTKWRRYILPLFRLREIKGILIGQHFGPLEGARITLNGWRTVTTQADGSFRFRFVMRPKSSLTVEWHEAELRDWIEVYAVNRVNELKLKWPLLIRGQVVTTTGEPVSQLSVTLNQSLKTITDAHGAFIFPKTLIERDASYQLLFECQGRSFLHHFKPQPDAHLLHRFIIEDHQLYHLEDRPAAQASAPNIERFTRTLKLGIFTFLISLSAMALAIYLSREAPLVHIDPYALPLVIQDASQPPPQRAPRVSGVDVWSRAGMLERGAQTMIDDERLSSAHDASSSAQPHAPDLDPDLDPDPEHITPHIAPDLDEPLEVTETCGEMEFDYLRYVVPRGMEGLLLASVFGSWRSWHEISEQNRLTRSQLQAGQRIRLKLPLYSWRLYQHRGQEEWRAMLKSAGCDQSGEPNSDQRRSRDTLKLCEQLIQAWNPHLYTRRLKRGDLLLINPTLLRERPFERSTISRIEKLRRTSGKRRKKPRALLAPRCGLKSMSEPRDTPSVDPLR